MSSTIDLHEQWLNNNDLWEEYKEEVLSDRDSSEHKRYMLDNEQCYIEWCEEKYVNE